MLLLLPLPLPVHQPTTVGAGNRLGMANQRRCPNQPNRCQSCFGGYDSINININSRNEVTPHILSPDPLHSLQTHTLS